MAYDLMLSGGRVIDPAQNLDAKVDVAFAEGRVAAVGPNLARDQAKSVRDVSGRIVTPGLIDLHTHVYWGGTSLGVDPMMLARRSAVVTVADAGSAGPGNVHGFRKHIIEATPVRVLPYINVSFAGIFAYSRALMVGECSDIRLINARECARVAREHKDLIVGVKVRVGGTASFGTGVAPLDIAIEAADELGLPVMAHLDTPPPSPREVLTRLRPGDVLTHCFPPSPNAPVHGDGRMRDEAPAARDRGVVFDIGHCPASPGFPTARPPLAPGSAPDVISSDVHQLSLGGPAFDLLVTMSKFLSLGMSLNTVVRCTTTAAATALRRPDLASLKPGAPADASVLELATGRFEYTDVIGETIIREPRLKPAGPLGHGTWLETP